MGGGGGKTKKVEPPQRQTYGNIMVKCQQQKQSLSSLIPLHKCQLKLLGGKPCLHYKCFNALFALQMFLMSDNAKEPPRLVKAASQTQCWQNISPLFVPFRGFILWAKSCPQKAGMETVTITGEPWAILTLIVWCKLEAWTSFPPVSDRKTGKRKKEHLKTKNLLWAIFSFAIFSFKCLRQGGWFSIPPFCKWLWEVPWMLAEGFNLLHSRLVGSTQMFYSVFLCKVFLCKAIDSMIMIITIYTHTVFNTVFNTNHVNHFDNNVLCA